MTELSQEFSLQEAAGAVLTDESQSSTEPTDSSHGSSPTEKIDLLPKHFGRYRIVRKLGAGAMGSVYLAHDTKLDAQVALKIPSSRGCVDRRRLQRFYREAQVAFKLRHPHICPVHDVGEIDGIHYISMGFVDGQPLSAFVKPMASGQIARVIHVLALALHEAHRQGIVHRDLKPANIMMDRQCKPIVMDFGLARHSTDEHLTHTGELVGTPAYMAPEQVEGNLAQIGPKADIYSLGVIMYELLAGRMPFRGSVVSVLAQILNSQPTPLATHNPDVDPRLARICLKAMAKQIEDRYESMQQLAADLEDYQQRDTGEPPRSEVVTLPESDSSLGLAISASVPPRISNRSKRTLCSLTLSSLLVLTLLAGCFFKWSQPAQTPGQTIQRGYASIASPATQPAGGEVQRTSRTQIDADEQTSDSQKPINDLEIESKQAETALQKLHFRDAIAAYSQVILKNPENAGYYFARARAWIGVQEYGKALSDISEAIALAPRNSEFLSQRGLTYSLRGIVYKYGGNESRAQTDFDRSLADHAKALEFSPEDAHSYSMRGQSYSLMQNYEQATHDFERAIELEPKAPQHWVARAAMYSVTGELARVIADYTQAIALDPANATYHSARAIAYQQKGDLLQARRGFADAILLAPEKAGLYASRAVAFSYERDVWEQVEADFAKALELDPANADLYYWRGLHCEHARHEVDRAILDYSEAIRIDSRSAAYLAARAAAFARKGDFDSAIRDYGDAIQFAPEHARASYYAQRASQYAFPRGDFDDAIADYTRAIRIEPENATFYARRADAYQQKKDIPTAIADLTDAIRLDPLNKSYQASMYAARAAMSGGTADFESALADYNQSIRSEPRNAAHFLMRGLFYRGRNELDAALADFTTAIELDPQNATYRAARAYTYVMKKEYPNALADYADAIDRDSDNAGYRADRASVYDELGDDDAAVAEYTAAIRLDPKTAHYYYMRANRYYDQGRWDQAIADLTSAITLEPEDESHYLSRSLAYQQKGDLARAKADEDKAKDLERRSHGS